MPTRLASGRARTWTPGEPQTGEEEEGSAGPERPRGVWEELGAPAHHEPRAGDKSAGPRRAPGPADLPENEPTSGYRGDSHRHENGSSAQTLFETPSSVDTQKLLPLLSAPSSFCPLLSPDASQKPQRLCPPRASLSSVLWPGDGVPVRGAWAYTLSFRGRGARTLGVVSGSGAVNSGVSLTSRGQTENSGKPGRRRAKVRS